MTEMTTSALHRQVLALTVFLVCAAAVTPAALAQQQQLPGCPDKCGDISIPYPFGIGAGCARDQYFELECNRTNSPPRLIVSTHRQHLVNLSLADGEATALINARRQCYNSTEGLIGDANNYVNKDITLVGSNAYRFSAARNRFVALGCPNMGYFVDTVGYYVSGCTSICRPSQGSGASTGGCTGEGCCQSKLPNNTDYYELYIQTFKPGEGDPILRSGTTSCRYVFLAEDKWIDTTYRGSPDFNRTDDFAVPVVLDWAIRDVYNCSAAMRNMTNYACRSAHSGCFNTNDGQGYQCKCSQGYEGNPYLNDGCQDIDECKHLDKYPCHGVCTNVPGNYTCECPQGTSGDATMKNGCRPKDKFTLALKVFTGVSVGVFMSVFMCFWLYLGLQKRKLIRTEQRFFEQNGGVILQ